MIEQGFNKDDLEKQLQEEEAKMGVNSESTEAKNNIEEKKESPESSKEAVENVAEKELSSKVELLEKNVNIVEKNVEEIGGPEVVNQVLNKMSPEDKKVIEDKIKNKELDIYHRERNLKYGYGSIDELWELAKEITTGNTLKNKKSDFLAEKIFNKLSNVVVSPTIGLPLVILSGPFKLAQQFARKIKLGSEKRKLVKLEKQNS